MGFFRPVAMVRVGLVGLKQDRDRILSALHDLGVVQVEPLSKGISELLETEHGGERQRLLADQLLRFRGLKSALPPTPDGAPRTFGDIEEVLAAARAVAIDGEVGELRREEDRLLSERRTTAETRALLERFSFYQNRLELLTATHLLAFFGEAPRESFGELRGTIQSAGDSVFLDEPVDGTVRFVVAVRREQAETVSRLAQQRGVLLSAVPRLEGSIAEELPALAEKQASLERRLEEIRARLGAIAREWYQPVAQIEEALAIESRKLEVWTRMGAGRDSFAVEGWVPRRAHGDLARAVEFASEGRAHLYWVPTREPAPTLLDNPSGVRWYEFFIRFYALPQANEWDPTWLFALVFPLFFGLMLGDIGYGLVILVISLWMLAGFSGGQHLPKFLRNFLKVILSPRGMQSLARTLLLGCAIAIGFGVCLNEFFGFHLLPFTLVHAEEGSGVTFLLKLAGYLGLAMVTAGFLLGAAKEYLHHHPRGALGKLGGVAFSWGIAFVGLTLLQKGSFSPAANPAIGVWYGLLGGGVALLLLAEGPLMGAMGLIESISHILSHTRLVGILLASVIFALVVNTVFTSGIAAGGWHLFFGIAILLLGQIFNVVIGVFEPGIQGVRLIFVENFSKYYEGNGRPFRPFGTARTHTAPHPLPPAPAPAPRAGAPAG